MTLHELEFKSAPYLAAGGFMVPRVARAVINGHTVEARSRMNKGRSGKAFTTTWTVDGRRVARADLAGLIEA